ncbi:unnamed protein product [Larinioides sclopetarius]|uniref:Uncharacterized protein n=1 Tax=Larinioides sclopetarius TaxID=280406 RepID=A0AAV1ZQF2_9ARAC
MIFRVSSSAVKTDQWLSPKKSNVGIFDVTCIRSMDLMQWVRETSLPYLKFVGKKTSLLWSWSDQEISKNFLESGFALEHWVSDQKQLKPLMCKAASIISLFNSPLNKCT